MKNSLRISAIVMTLLITAFTYAQTISNNLVVFSQDGYKFTLIVNGLKQNTDPQTNVKVVGLNAPNYKVRVIFEDAAKATIDQNISMMWGGETLNNKELTCSIQQGKKGLKLKPQSAADISGPSTSSATQVVYQFNASAPGTMVGSTTTTTTSSSSTTTTNGGGGVVTMNTGVDGNGTGGSTTTTVNDGMGGSTSTTTTTSTTSTGNGANTNVGMNANGVGIGINININDGMGGMGGTTSTSTTTTTTSSSTSSTSTNMGGTTTTTSAGGNNVVSSDACAWPMNSSDFANAKSSIEKQSFEDGKLKVAKQILSTNCMSTAQVKEIMGMFSFEETKLDWAKFAYGKTTDPNNYYQLNDGFTYSTSTDALDEYIKQHPHQ